MMRSFGRRLPHLNKREGRGIFRLALLVATLATLVSIPATKRLAAEGPPAETGTAAPAAETHASAAAHAEAPHAEAGHEAKHEEHAPELPNLVTLLHDHFVVQAEKEGRQPAAWAQFLERWEDQFFIFLFIVLLVSVAAVASRKLRDNPGPLQNGVESVVEKLDDFVQGIVGHRGRALVPFLGTLFVFILTMNYAGLVPFLKSPTASINTTLAMAICVFLYVQWTGIRSLGLFGYLDHLAGSPRDPVGFVLLPLMLPLHIVGELVKPLSLSLRLFGNVTGEDVLLAVFVGLGVGLVGAVVHGAPFGLPLQAMVYPLLLIFGFIQALVFTLLSTIYFYMMLPHEEHH
jgi:F-type H+-transporting ATPase subunit a